MMEIQPMEMVEIPLAQLKQGGVALLVILQQQVNELKYEEMVL